MPELARVINLEPCAGNSSRWHRHTLINCGIKQRLGQHSPPGIVIPIVRTGVILHRPQTQRLERYHSFDVAASPMFQRFEELFRSRLAFHLGEQEGMFSGRGGERVVKKWQHNGTRPVFNGAASGAVVLVMGNEEDGSGLRFGVQAGSAFTLTGW